MPLVNSTEEECLESCRDCWTCLIECEFVLSSYQCVCRLGFEGNPTCGKASDSTILALVASLVVLAVLLLIRAVNAKQRIRSAEHQKQLYEAAAASSARPQREHTSSAFILSTRQHIAEVKSSRSSIAKRNSLVLIESKKSSSESFDSQLPSSDCWTTFSLEDLRSLDGRRRPQVRGDSSASICRPVLYPISVKLSDEFVLRPVIATDSKIYNYGRVYLPVRDDE